MILHWPGLVGWLSENPVWLFSGVSSAAPGHGVLTGYPGWIDGNAGVTTQALGGLAARDWLAGEVPWWNPYSGVGLPLAAEMQNSAFFLPFVLLLRCFDGVVYLKIALQIVAGFGCRALLRELGLHPVAVLAGALCFALNGSFAWFGHGPVMPIAFLPLTLFGIERARRAPWQGAGLVGLGIGWSLLAGFPETAYFDGLLALGWAGLRVAGAGAGRWRLAAAIGGGGVIGLAIAAPPVVAFVVSLPGSFLSGHVGVSDARFHPDNRAPLLFPYIFGPPMFGGLRLTGAASMAQFIHWFRTAGYFDLGLVTLAPMALRRDAGQVGLRVLLAVWCGLALGRALGVPGLSFVVDLVPLVRNTVVHLYIVPSCQMAVTMLGAVALSDLLAGRGSVGRVVVGGGVAVGLGAASLWGAAPVWHALGGVASAEVYAAASLGAGVAVVGAVCWLALWRPRCLGVLLVGEAAVLCFIPLLAGTPAPRRLDWAAMDWLRGHAGLARVHAVASLSPNYGAWFGVAAIDHNYLPVPMRWVADVRATLLPGMDGVNNFAAATDPAGLAALRARVPALQAHGVGYVLVPDGVDPFGRTVLVPVAAAGNRPWRLTGVLGGAIDAARIGAGGVVVGAAIDIGTYGGTADGVLRVRLCQAGRCQGGAARVAGAADDRDLAIRLDAPLVLRAGVAVTYALSMAPGERVAPAVWLFPAPAAMAGEAVSPGFAPRLALRFGAAPGQPVKVYGDAMVGIFRLPGAAAYMAAPGCSLAVASRLAATATCAAPSTLLRRELFDPGWRARVDGRRVSVRPEGIYQAIAVPGGTSHIRFGYAPPGGLIAALACALGLALLAVCGWSGRRESNPRMQLGRLPFYH